MTPRSLLSILFNAEKALDLVQTALDLGLLARLDAGPVTLGELCERANAVPLRMYKFMDGLESLGLVVRRQPRDELSSASYESAQPLEEAARAVLGSASIERDRDKWGWRALHGKLPEILRGQSSIRDFDWPPRTEAQIAAFEASMAAGCAPIVEAFRASAAKLWRGGGERWLDVGGGDGTLVRDVLLEQASLSADVYNLPAVEPLVMRRRDEAGLGGRMGFAAGDFLGEPLPRGYGVLSFVRVLHDWPAETARALLAKAKDALPSGGRVVVCEEFRTTERLAIQFFWTYFLMGVDSCVSRLREREWYESALGDLGFVDLEVHAGAFEILVATRP